MRFNLVDCYFGSGTGLGGLGAGSTLPGPIQGSQLMSPPHLPPELIREGPFLIAVIRAE